MYDFFWNLIPYLGLFLICAFITRLIFRINTIVDYQKKQYEMLELIYRKLSNGSETDATDTADQVATPKKYGEIKIDPNKNYFQ